jgi:uncharacterized protein (TIGR02271 family)
MSTSDTIEWSNIVKKEARGVSDDFDLGEVQEIGSNYIMTQKGVMNKDRFYVPKYLAYGFDGHTLWFNVTEYQARNSFLRDSPPATGEYARYRTSEIPADIETRIPVLEERLNVSKRASTTEATITKEPMTETKTMGVPVTHEEITVERRPATDATARERPVQSKTEIKVPLTREEVQVTKEPRVKEEVVIKKEPVTETRTVSDTVTSERVDVKDRASD